MILYTFAYTEFYFTPRYWRDFTGDDFNFPDHAVIVVISTGLFGAIGALIGRTFEDWRTVRWRDHLRNR